jgi:hypothetical protein
MLLSLSGFVELLGDFVPGSGEFFTGGLDGLSIGAFQGFFDLIEGCLDFGLVVAGEFITVFLEHLLGAIDGAIGLVASFDLFALFLIVLSIGFGFAAIRSISSLVRRCWQ